MVRHMRKIIIMIMVLIMLVLLPISSGNNLSIIDVEKETKENKINKYNNYFLNFETVAEGFNSPVVLTHAGDRSNRLFVADQIGKIYVIEDGELLSDPYLDLTEKVLDLDETYDERGLLGLAFHPDYKINGKFYVYYSSPKSGEGINHESILSEFHVLNDNTNQANTFSERVIFRLDQPEANHNGGQLAFGPDGYLYVGLGDGGGAGDQHGEIGNGQNINTYLGTILRIDIDSYNDPYGIPPDNPFIDSHGLDEIFAYGLRNPWKFSFDDETGRLFAGDVGQDQWEEIDIVVNGGNYGWRIMEGAHFYDETLLDELDIDMDSLEQPIHEYSHDIGKTVIGGYIYRGDIESPLYGKYIFGDWSTDFTVADGRIYYLSQDNSGNWLRSEFRLLEQFNRFILGFGEDENDELYILSKTNLGPTGTTGDVRKLIFNQPPSAPIIDGETNGNSDEEYEYTFYSVDPKDEDIYIWVTWGDGCPAVEWLGPYESGEEIKLTHSFAGKGTFIVSAKAKDVHGLESQWSELSVTMPKNKDLPVKIERRQFISFLLKTYFPNIFNELN